MTHHPLPACRRRTLLLAAASLPAAFAARAQNDAAWPQKPVTIIVPFPAGGGTDTITRMIAHQMQQATGQGFVVDNRPGATGTIGAATFKRTASTDGYTLMLSSLGTFVIAPHLYKSVQYNALQDFAYITRPVQAPNVLVAAPGQSTRTAADVVAQLRASPGKVSFASSGHGSSDHLSAELFWQQTGTQGLHVPYKGGAPAMNDLLGNQVDYYFGNINFVLPHLRAGKLHAIATTGGARSPILPDVPTLHEAGVPGVEVYSWQGLVAPRGISAALKAQIAQAAIAAMQDAKLRKTMTDQGMDIVADTPQEFAAFAAREYARWQTLIAQRGIRLD